MRKARAVIGGFVSALFLLPLVLFVTPNRAYAAGEGAVLSQNGIRVELALPPGCTDIEQLSDWLLASWGEYSVTLEIQDRSVEKLLEMNQETYEWLLERDASTTLETLPDIETGLGSFAVRSLHYEDNAVALDAYLQLNHRYSYTITLHGKGDIPYEALRAFTEITVASTPLQFDRTALIMMAVMLFCALSCIVPELWQKHFWPQAEGVVVDVQGHRRHVCVHISYRNEDGALLVGEENLATVFGLLYNRLVGQGIPISYCKKRPNRVNILRNKTDYIIGIVFLLLAVGFLFLSVEVA